MIIILHGENVLQSRARLNVLVSQAKGKGIAEIIRLEDQSLTLTELKQALEAKSLFGNQKLVIVENLLCGSATSLRENVINYLKSSIPETRLILWEAKSISKSVLAKLPKGTQITESKVSRKLFLFLDSLKPHNTRQMLSLLHQVITQEAPELVFYMLCRRLAALIVNKDSADGQSLPSWQKNRLTHQAGSFTQETLLEHHDRFYALDRQMKTGTSAFSLTLALELLLTEI